MNDFNRLFGDLYDSVSSQPKDIAVAKAMDSTSFSMRESMESLPAGPQEEYLLQTQIRPHFGKVGINNTPIGTHPDFINLEGSQGGTEKHYVCTIFVDIKGSTRLSLLYPLETVFLFKNAVIKTCVETIRSLDGYVHRIMGDAVMGFFGGNDIDKEDAIADAINCSVVLRAILEESIKPWMEENGLDAKDFGFRIGCDFGDDDEVLWGSFGYQNVGEVSATGLAVDMASKLQSLAGKNQTMLGQGLLDYVNWPDKYSKIKQKEKNGNLINLPVVTPNLTDTNGNPINYKMKQLAYHNALEVSPLPRSFRSNIDGSNIIDNLAINYKCFTIQDDEKTEYISASKFLDKDISLLFEVVASTNNRLSFPLRVSFAKTNHGLAAPEDGRDVEQEAKIKFINKRRTGGYNKAPAMFSTVTIDEYTSYRGLHTMKCEIVDNNGCLLFRDWIGVMIK